MSHRKINRIRLSSLTFACFLFSETVVCSLQSDMQFIPYTT